MLIASSFRQSLLALAAASALSLGCSSADPIPANEGAENAAQSASGTTPAAATGTHVGVHGMVLFGTATERMYLSHIPLYDQPHNMQVIVEVKVDSGIPAAQQLFGTKQFTFNPRQAFSLGDLAAGTLTSVTGTVYLGDFENGGTPAFRSVKFNVQRVIFQRDMSPTMAVNPSLDYIAVGTPAQPYLVHLIDAPPSFDQIVGVKLPQDSALDAAALQAGTLVRISGNQQNVVTKRLKPQAVVSATQVGSSNSTSTPPPGKIGSIEVLGESSCMPGDQFFGDCPAAQ